MKKQFIVGVILGFITIFILVILIFIFAERISINF
jgi:hypothetical protein